ncbi:hypothetical protein JCM14036_33620 [Desulfotomaculum defluvii]
MSLGKKAAKYLIKNNNIEDEDQKEILIYGAEVFFGTFFGIIFTLLIGYVLGLQFQIFYMLLISILIRKTTGGAHSNDPLNCLLITVIIYNVIAYFSLLTINVIKSYMLLTITIIFILGLIIIYLKAPVESPQKPLGKQQRKTLRVLSLVFVGVIYVLQLLFYINNIHPLTNYSVSMIMLWQYFMLTTWGQGLMNLIDHFLFTYCFWRR